MTKQQQLGMAGEKESKCSGEFPRLRFNSGDDPFDFARKSVQHSKDWLAFHDIAISDDYLKGYIYAYLKLSSGTDPSVFELIFKVAHPIDTDPSRSPHVFKPEAAENSPIGDGDEVERALVLAVRRESANRPEKIIPSLVWLKCPQQCEDLGVHSNTCALRHMSGELGGVLGEWERHLSDPRGQHISTVTDSLVHRVPKVCENLGRGDSQLWGKPLSIAEYDYLFAGSSIIFENDIISVIGNGCGDNRLKIEDASFSGFY